MDDKARLPKTKTAWRAALTAALVYAGLTGKVYRSLNAGRTWKVLGTGLPVDAPITDLLPSATNPHRLYAVARRMADRRPFVILSRPEASAVLPRCFVDDVGRAIAMAATDDRAAGRTYNVVDDPSFVERDWVALVARVLRWEGRVVELPPEAMPAHMKDDEPMDWSVSIAVSAGRIRSELGWKVGSAREEAIARTVEWELAHPPEKLPPRDDQAEDRAIAEVAL